MKLHITPKQVKELTEEQFFNLFSNQHWECVRRKDWADYHHKKVTIGRMIEMLKCSKWMIKIMESMEGFWRVELDTINGRSYYRKELCDALWEAVKSLA